MSSPIVMPSQSDPASLDELRGDCRRIDATWSTPVPGAPPSHASARVSAAPAVEVPAHGADLIEGMAGYGG